MILNKAIKILKELKYERRKIDQYFPELDLQILGTKKQNASNICIIVPGFFNPELDNTKNWEEIIDYTKNYANT